MKYDFESDSPRSLAIRMPLSRYFILKALCDGPKTQTELADVADVSTASMTGIRDFLLRNKLMTSEIPEEGESAPDRRRVVSFITEKGRNIVSAYEEIAAQIVKAKK